MGAQNGCLSIYSGSGREYVYTPLDSLFLCLAFLEWHAFENQQIYINVVNWHFLRQSNSATRLSPLVRF